MAPVRVRLLICSAATVMTGVLAPQAYAAAPRAHGTQKMTTLRFVITGCPPGCSIAAFNGVILPKNDEQALDKATVHSGRAVLHVPTALTKPLFFIVDDAAHDQAGEGLVGVVTRYEADTVGQVVSAEHAAKQRKAADCWVGTTRADVTFRLRAQRFASVVNGFPGHSLRVWASPAVRSTGPMAETFEGARPKQDISC